MRSRNKQTIYDIAEKAGSSPSTVASALNGSWQARRISKETVQRIQKIAESAGYSVNRQARGLRKARSGLAGMLLPEHENRFFAALSQAFATEVRRRGLCPAIVTTGRDPKMQATSLAELISYSVDVFVVAGASEPETLAKICRDASVPHVFVDQPCASAPSVVSDNFTGAADLTHHLIDRMGLTRTNDPQDQLYFFGGDATSYATGQRIAGFREAVQSRGAQFGTSQIVACGYDPDQCAQSFAAMREQLGSLPRGLFVNSIAAFDGVAQVLKDLGADEIGRSVIGCYDFEPFGSLLPFPLHMVRQRADVLITEALSHLDGEDQSPTLTHIRPELIPGREPVGSKRRSGAETAMT